jgi:Predicted SAM-dependent methyltransferase
MQLSERLKAVAGLVKPCEVIADVGCDHGYLPIYLVQAGIVGRAIAMDVNVGPLKSAKANIAAHHCDDKIETRLSDGVMALKADEVDGVVIAGMGGNLIIKILAEGKDVLASVKELVLQPQSEITEVRKFLQANGYAIVTENMICEDDKYYPMMKVVHGEMKLTREIDFIYGPCLLKDRNPVLKHFLKKQSKTLEKVIKQISEAGSDASYVRVQEIKQEMCLNKMARDEYE